MQAGAGVVPVQPPAEQQQKPAAGVGAKLRDSLRSSSNSLRSSGAELPGSELRTSLRSSGSELTLASNPIAASFVEDDIVRPPS